MNAPPRAEYAPVAATARSSSLVDRLGTMLCESPASDPAGKKLRMLAEAGLDRLPLPGSGRTIERWRALALVASHDLSLAKLYEAHTDALAILAELQAGDRAGPGSLWAVWAAEAPGRRVQCVREPTGQLRLRGRKAWCSGSAEASHGLVTVWEVDGRGPWLAAVRMNQPSIAIEAGDWQAIAMAGAAARELHFEGAEAFGIGGCADYLSRPGFWHGGAGIAACWYGGACALARAVQRARPADPLRTASLGRIDVRLRATAALLRETAAWIDDHPRADARAQALRVRLAAEACAGEVAEEAGRALGAAAYCCDPAFARMAADLPVFVRQSHGDRDLAALGEQLQAQGGNAWAL